MKDKLIQAEMITKVQRQKVNKRMKNIYTLVTPDGTGSKTLCWSSLGTWECKGKIQ